MSTCACPDPTTYEDDNGIERCWECGDTSAPTSTPRPTEADVEALASVIDEATAYTQPGRGLVTLNTARAEAVLTSDWLAERDAEHEAEVENLVNNWRTHEERGNIQRARAEAAERDRDEARRELADLRAVATNRIVHDYRGGLCPDEIEGYGSRDPECPACQIIKRSDALLPTEDDR